MRVKSKLLCRASEKIYELLDIAEIGNGNVVSPVYSECDGRLPLPCRLFFLEKGGASARAVAVYPDLPIENAFYTLAELLPNGDLTDSASVNVNFKSAKWHSRLNYRTNASGCAAIRCIDERTPEYGDTNLKLLTVISTPSHVILRVAATWPEITQNDDMQFTFLNNRLETVSSDFVLLGSTSLPSRVAGAPAHRRTTFSVRVPWNQEILYVLAHSESRPGQDFTWTITQAECDALREPMDRLLYHHAGLDPYYGEWLSLHRATRYELDSQRAHQPANGVKFSVIVPLYKTPVNLFRDMADSVLNQTYENWELVLVNASPESAELADEVERCCEKDQRVRSLTLPKNGGISENTNAGIAMAEGDYVCFFDHDDLLEPDALYEYARAISEDPDIDLLYCDEDKLMPDGTYAMPFFKPDFSIDMLRNNNYVCHMLTIRKTLLDQLEPNTAEFDGAQDHNLTLEAAERTRHIHHVPRILYHWRVTPSSTASGSDSKPYAVKSGIRAVSRHLERLGLRATVSAAERPFTYKIIYDVPEPHPLVSIVIPTKDNAPILQRCIESIINRTTYNNYEIVLVDNGSEKDETRSLYTKLISSHGDRIRIEAYSKEFNFSRLVNVGARASRGSYLLLLNNDTEVVTENWIEIMLGLCARSDVGAVGVKLLYPDGTVQHAGVNTTGEPGHFFTHIPDGSHSYFELLETPRNLSAVTAACMMTARSSFDLVGGFDEELAVAYNDIDYCFRLQEKDLLIVYSPLVTLYHYESLSRGFDEDPASRARYLKEKATLTARWADRFSRTDPYYTPNLRHGLPESCYYVF
ncbi:glycosyltransferase family 2 protein [Thermophilibacter sp. ZX-H3]|uniref:glycosyltransferase family 2 protein n=1 Tax=unclassified Thermophilibacter TaxID=2847308 RepID=UPI0040408B91